MSKSNTSFQFLMNVTPSGSSGVTTRTFPFEGCADIRVKIGQNDRSTEINLPFLVITQKINNTISDFKTITHSLQKKTEIKTMVSILQKVFDNVDRSRMKYFVKVLQHSDSNCSRVPEVKVK